MAKTAFLTDLQKQAIELLVAGQFYPEATMKALHEELGVHQTTLDDWRNDKHFIEAYRRRREAYRVDFTDLKLAQRRERVKEMEKLYYTLGNSKVQLKIQLLREIRTEVGDNHPVQVELQGRVAHGHLHQAQPAPEFAIEGRASSIEEWTPSTPTEPVEPDLDQDPS